MFWKRSARPAAAFLAVGVLALTLWGLHHRATPAASTRPSTPSPSSSPAMTTKATYVAPQFRNRIPGMPPVIDNNVYSQDKAGMLAPQVRHDPQLLYVPDSTGSTVTVISQKTHKIIRVIPVGYLSQHVVPSYDLKTLYTNSSVANQLIAINPRTGLRGRAISMPRPYNLYFTPDGKTAVVMIEQYDTIRFADAEDVPHDQGPEVPRLPGPQPRGLLRQRSVLRGDL